MDGGGVPFVACVGAVGFEGEHREEEVMDGGELLVEVMYVLIVFPGQVSDEGMQGRGRWLGQCHRNGR